MMTPEAKAQKRLEIAERKAALAAFDAAMAGTVKRAPKPEPKAEPASYTVVKLTSAVTTKARGAKAAATRRRNAARRAAV